MLFLTYFYTDRMSNLSLFQKMSDKQTFPFIICVFPIQMEDKMLDTLKLHQIKSPIKSWGHIWQCYYINYNLL